MTRCLIVNADDFGRTQGVSDGILDAHLKGIVTSTSAMMNLPETRQHVAQALSKAPDLGIGVHLNLTAGPPVLAAEQVPDLVDSQGLFNGYAKLCARIGRLPIDQVQAEWRAQIDEMIATGVEPDHLDSHHFVVELSPELWELYLGLARDLRVPVRGPRPPRVGHQKLLPTGDSPEALSFDRARALLRESGVTTSDGLRVDFYGEDANQELFEHLLQQLPHGVTEVMTHPGKPDGELAKLSSYVEPRLAEFEVLTSRATRIAVEAGQINLVSFRDALRG